MQRPLVIILAETRAYGLTFDHFKENLLDALGADLALCVADNEREWTYPVLQYLRFRRCVEQVKTKNLDRLGEAKAALRRWAKRAQRYVGKRVKLLRSGWPGPD